MLRTPIHNGRKAPQSPLRRKVGSTLSRKHSEMSGICGSKVNFAFDVVMGNSGGGRYKVTRGRSISDSLFMNHIDDLVGNLLSGGKNKLLF